jgi:hypothetical protein
MDNSQVAIIADRSLSQNPNIIDHYVRLFRQVLATIPIEVIISSTWPATAWQL